MFLKILKHTKQDKADDELKADRGDDLTAEEKEEEGGKKEEEKEELTAEELEAAKGKKKEEGKEEEGKEEGEEEDITEPRIPKSRLDAKNRLLREERRRREAAENELASLRETKEEPKPELSDDLEAQLDALEEKIIDAKADGDRDEERKLRREIRKLDRKIQQEMISQVATKSAADAVNASDYDQVIDSIENDYPELNPDPENDKYDKDKVTEVQDLTAAFEAGGNTPAEAVIRAVNYAFPNKDNKLTTIRNKKVTDVKKNLDAEGRQPPDLDAAGKNSDTKGKSGEDKDVDKLSEAEFDALPAETRARMRGDFL